MGTARSLSAVLACAALFGCASLSEDQCLTGDWGAIGYQDGSNGQGLSRIDEHAKACAKVGITPDRAAWFAARDQGLRVFCTPENGFLLGRDNRAHNSVCVPPQGRDFLAAYADGQVVGEALRRLNQARSDRDTTALRARQAEAAMKTDEARLADPATPSAERDAIRARLQRLRDDRNRFLDDVRRQERVIRDLEYDADRLRERFAPSYGRGW